MWELEERVLMRMMIGKKRRKGGSGLERIWMRRGKDPQCCCGPKGAVGDV
jgi:hypothetical protein